MKKERNEFRGLVYSRFNTQSSFANEIGWSKQKVSKIINNMQVPTVRDIEALSCCLEKPVEDIVNLFLSN